VASADFYSPANWETLILPTDITFLVFLVNNWQYLKTKRGPKNEAPKMRNQLLRGSTKKEP
jgi:hypothetical protein